MIFSRTLIDRIPPLLDAYLPPPAPRIMHPVVLRRASSGDEPLIAAMLGTLSAHTRYLRYFTTRPLDGAQALREARRMTSASQTTLLAAQARGPAEAIAVAELVPDRGQPGVAEMAVLVRDDEQGKGLGTLLGQYLLRIARAQELRQIRAVVLAENRAALGMVRRMGAPYTIVSHETELEIEIEV